MTDITANVDIIRTKLHRPPVTRDLVPRTQLLERLEYHRQRPLTLVSAPAGYGKSTLVSHWLESNGCSGAWVSLDEYDDDLRQFVTYMVAAVQTMFPETCQNMQALLSAPELPPVPALVSALLNDLAQLPECVILVFDDYQYIDDQSVHELLRAVLRHPPQSLHLVLITRLDPPLPIPSLRAKGRITEIRVQDLRFSAAETSAFLQQTMEIAVDDEIAAMLEKRAEGWVTGLRFATLSVRSQEDIERLLSGLPQDERYAMDYLMGEVLSQQPPIIQDYLLVTAILNRLCAPLCETMYQFIRESTAELDGREFLNWLERDNLFVIPLDNQQHWFRYHHLFQELLKHQVTQRFSPSELTALHARASTWFAEHGLIEEAFYHALEGGDPDGAVRLIAQHRHDLMNREQWAHLDRWLRLLPSDRVEQVPELLLIKAWLCELRVRFTELEAILKQIEPLLADPPSSPSTAWKSLQAEFDTLGALCAYLHGDARQAITLARQALDSISPHAHCARGYAQCMLAFGHQMTGDLKQAYEVVYSALKEDDSPGKTYHSRLLLTLCFVQWIAADLTGLQETARQTLKLGRERHLPESIHVAHYCLGTVSYLRNELPDTEHYLHEVGTNPYQPTTLNFAYSACVLALSLQARNKHEEADKVAKAITRHALDLSNTELLQFAEALQAELALRQGNIAKATQWAGNFSPRPFNPGYRCYLPQMTLARVLVAQETPESSQQALELLSQLQEYYRSIHNTSVLIDVLALQALLYDSQGEESMAFDCLGEALVLAEPGGFIRPFLDLGPGMAHLLKRLMKQNVAMRYIGKLLKEFRDEELRTGHHAVQLPIEPPSSSSSRPLIEDLTKRESEILGLLAQRMSNQEIADTLFISPETVKRHVMNTYQKLDVHNRREAVAKAQALMILPEN